MRKHVALAAITCSRGPPCIPGKTARSMAAACSSLQRTKPERGPASVLCVVDVTKSQCGDGVRVQPGRDETCEVRHVAKQERADLVGDRAEAVGLDRPRVGRAAADDQLRAMLFRECEHLVVVDDVRLAADAVVDDRVEPAGEVDLETVREVPAVSRAGATGSCRRDRGTRSRRPCSSARPRAAGRWRARRRRAPSRGR